MTKRQGTLGPGRPLSVRAGAATMVVVLAVQFLLGMLTNLYISLPAHSYGGAFAMGRMMTAMTSGTGAGLPLLMFHMMLGPLMVIVALVTLVASIASRRQRDIVLGTVGLLSILLAGYGGLSFLLGGGHNAASLIMSLGFLAAFSAYFTQVSTAG